MTGRGHDPIPEPSADGDALDRELRRALRPLDRDPAAVAQEVLAHLPSEPPVPATRPRRAPPTAAPRGHIPWWAAAATLALGFGVGWWAADLLRPEPSTPPTDLVQSNSGNAVGGDTLATPTGSGPGASDTDPTPIDRPKEPTVEERAGLDVRLLGPVTVLEPDLPPTPLPADRYIMAQGTRFDTGPSRAGGFSYPEELLFRLDRETNATIGPRREASVDSGRIWISAVGPERQRLRTPFGSLEVGKGALMVTIGQGRADVLVLSGDVDARPADGPQRSVRSGRWFALREDRVGDERAAGFTGTATAWMTEFVVLQLDPSERIARAEQMVQALTDDRYRDEARIEILRLGADSVPSLLRLARDHRDREVRIAAANLVRRVADYTSAKGLIPWLMAADEDIRERVFEALVRVTGTDVGTSLRFWREAPETERRAAMDQWQRLVEGR